MGSIRYWYNNGDFEEIQSHHKLISTILLHADKGLKVSFRTSGTRIPFYSDQFDLLRYIARVKNINLEVFCGKELLLRDITSLLRRNRVFKGALINVFIIDQEKLSGIFLFCEKYPDERFVTNEKGMELGWIKSLPHPGPKVIAGLVDSTQRIDLWDKFLAEQKINSAYFTNNSSKLVECNDGSIFIIKENTLYTPSLKTGAYPRAIRNEIIRKSPDLGLKIVETDKLEVAHLDAADEIFIANDISGIKWVVAHKGNRYFRKNSELFTNLLNRDWEAES